MSNVLLEMNLILSDRSKLSIIDVSQIHKRLYPKPCF